MKEEMNNMPNGTTEKCKYCYGTGANSARGVKLRCSVCKGKGEIAHA